jgi:peptidoglycan/LPS O-acetylase OafA/YrhL
MATLEQRAHVDVAERFPCFDGLRAMAALAVLLTHVSSTAGANGQFILGFLFARMDGGVAVFFVISGFLLYRPFVKSHLSAASVPATGQYLWRRALRIYPAYWLVVLVVVYVFGDKGIPHFQSFFLYFGLVHIYSQAHAYGPLVQSWTLATEIAFYVFLPVWALLVRTGSRGPFAVRFRRELIGIAVLVAISIGWKLFVLHHGIAGYNIGVLRLWLPWWLDMFAAGMLFAVLSVAVADHGLRTPARLDAPIAPVVSWLLALGAIWLVSAGIGLPIAGIAIPRHLLIPEHYLYLAVAILLVLPAVFGPQTRESSPVRRFLTTPVMVYLGLISYGIYLWHDPWIDRYLAWTSQRAFTIYSGSTPFASHTDLFFSVPFLTFLVAILGLTIASASVSWFVLEKPLLRLRHVFGRTTRVARG